MTEVQRLAKIMVLKDMRKEYELRAKYNGGVDYDCYRALDMAINALEQEPCTDVLDKIRADLHATAEMHEDGDYYLREEWIDEIFDKYKASSAGAERSDKE